MNQITVRLPETIYKRVKLEAGFAHRSLGAQILYMLEQYAFGERSEPIGPRIGQVFDEMEEKKEFVPSLPKTETKPNPAKLGSTAKHYVKDEFSQD